MKGQVVEQIPRYFATYDDKSIILQHSLMLCQLVLDNLSQLHLLPEPVELGAEGLMGVEEDVCLVVHRVHRHRLPGQVGVPLHVAAGREKP